MKNSFSKQEKIELVETALTWLVVFMMSIYGVMKVLQFKGAVNIDKTIPQLTAMEIMWAFYGYSFPFALTIGVFEILGATLLFFKKTRLIGCFFLSTILINIIIFSFYVSFFPFYGRILSHSIHIYLLLNF